MTAIVTAYGVGKFVHILAVLLTFGPTFAYPFFVAVAEKASPRSIPTVLRGIQRVDRFLVTPGLILILIAGIYLLSEGDIDASESWVTIGFIAVIVLFGMSHAFFAPRIRKALALAERDLEAGDELSRDYEAISKQVAIGGQIATLIVVVTIFFMVVKP